MPATLVRTALGLRSTWLTIGVLRLDRASRGSVVFGSTTHLSGLGRGLGATRLASSFDGAAWATVASSCRMQAGVVSFDVKPTRTTRYRIEAEGGASPALLVQVAPRLPLAKPTAVAPGVLSGSVKPKLPGAQIAIERRKGSSWVLVGEAVVGASGAFEVELDAPVPAGSYRARIDATEAFVGGHVSDVGGDRMRRIVVFAGVAGGDVGAAGDGRMRPALPSASPREPMPAVVARAIEQRTGSRPESLAPIPALVVELPAGVSLRGIRGIRYVEPLVTRQLAFTPTDPLASKQWYLTLEPLLRVVADAASRSSRIPVAVIDSGVDTGHPELAGKVLGAKSFVGGSARVRTRSGTGRSSPVSSPPGSTTASGSPGSRLPPSSWSRRS